MSTRKRKQEDEEDELVSLPDESDGEEEPEYVLSFVVFDAALAQWLCRARTWPASATPTRGVCARPRVVHHRHPIAWPLSQASKYLIGLLLEHLTNCHRYISSEDGEDYDDDEGEDDDAEAEAEGDEDDEAADNGMFSTLCAHLGDSVRTMRAMHCQHWPLTPPDDAPPVKKRKTAPAAADEEEAEGDDDAEDDAEDAGDDEDADSKPTNGTAKAAVKDVDAPAAEEDETETAAAGGDDEE